MPTPKTTKPDVLFRRPGQRTESYLFCPHCRHPLLRWSSYRSLPERMQVVWDPDRWLLPVPWQGALLLLVVLVLGSALHFAGPRLGQGTVVLVLVLGFLWAAVSAWLSWRARLRRRIHLDQILNPHDWVCAKCLHAQSGEAAPTS